LPATALSAPPQKWQSPTLAVDPGPINRMREQPDNAPEPQTIGEILAPNPNGQKPCLAPQH